MFNYETTPLEDWIQSLYDHLDIHEPCQLDLQDIAEKLDIWLYYKPLTSRALDRGGLYSMIIDSRLSACEQWQDFGHEACHLLRQSGNQFVLDRGMIELQETRADNFAYHFCVPTHMLLNLPLPSTRHEAISFVAETFSVTPYFARERLARFEKQVLSSQWSNQLAAAIEAEQRFKRTVGYDYTIRTDSSTMLYCRERGVVGYLK